MKKTGKALFLILRLSKSTLFVVFVFDFFHDLAFFVVFSYPVRY